MKTAVLLLCVAVMTYATVAVARPTPIDTGAYDDFINELSKCYDITNAVEFSGPFDSGAFCMYYLEPGYIPIDGSTALHDFGWYLVEPPSCRALVRLIEGRHFDCQRSVLQGDPGKLLPPQPGMLLRLAHQDDVHLGFWINREYDPTSEPVGSYGLHYTDPTLNADGERHVVMYQATYKTLPFDGCGGCACTEGYHVLPATGTVFLMFWEDSCYLWDDQVDYDLMVALFVVP